MVCVLSKVKELVSGHGPDNVQWLEELSPLIIKLQKCVDVMCGRARCGLTFFSLKVSE